MINQKVIPAVKDVKGFEKFMNSDLEVCLLMSLHLSVLQSLVDKAHKKSKKCLLHIDLINGLSNDEYGAQFAIQNIGVDGIVSTKASVIKVALKKNVIAIYRIFLIDTLSLSRSINRVKELKPNYIEILPATAWGVVSKIKDSIDIPIIGGGLIETKEEINQCIKSGMKAVTTSKIELWK